MSILSHIVIKFSYNIGRFNSNYINIYIQSCQYTSIPTVGS